MKQINRHYIQALTTLLYNPHIFNFFSGTVIKSNTKKVCVPGLNCYSCPSAAGACPIGSLQSIMGGRQQNISYYVTGLILLFGVVFGRLICGFLCPFGFFQDLVNKKKSPEIIIPGKIDNKLRYIKYFMLAGVLFIPILITDPFGIGMPAFCKYICPAGTLQGGIPLILTNKLLLKVIGVLFSWKVAVLIIITLASVFIYRPFCKYLCPLGAIYGLLNKYSLYQMNVDETSCTHCGKCKSVCGMGVDVTHNINSAECIRCGKCTESCPEHAIQSLSKFPLKRKSSLKG